MTKKLELTGQQFHRLLVLQEGNSTKTTSKWICKCNCGNIKEIVGTKLTQNKTKSCGCLKKEHKGGKIKHNEGSNKTKTKEYRTWNSIKQRCNNPKHHSYKWYKKNNINICEEWKNNFEAFLKHVGRAPTNKHTIDRIDNHKNYEPNNCRWVLPTTQIINQNIRKNNTTGTKGVYKIKNKERWIAKIWINKKEISLGYFKTIEDAIQARKIAEEKYYKPLLNQK